MKNNIKKIRIDRGINQLELCSILNISQSALSNKDPNRRPFTVNELIILSNYFNLNLEDLIILEKN